MTHIKVKYCGLTTLADIHHAITAGVDAIGLVFVKKSPRFVAVDSAAKLAQLAQQNGLKVVALFADDDVELVQQVITDVKPDILQFHGSESPKFCEQFDHRYWKAVPMLTVNDYQGYIEQYPTADAFLLDAFGGQQTGGSGECFNWFEWPDSLIDKLILAGGLNIDNIDGALQATGAKYIDTSSGIESSPGVKSRTKMIKLMQHIEKMNASN